MFRTGIDPITHRPVRDRAPNGKMWPRGFRNGNPGNFDYVPSIPWQGQIGLEVLPPGVKGRARFAVFRAAVWGIRAIFRDLITGQDRDGEVTIRQIIREWAPPNENDTDAYISVVCARTGFKPDQRLNLHSYDHAVPLARAIVDHEQGDPRAYGLATWYPDEVWDEAATRAGLVRTKPKPVTKDTEVLAAGGATVLAGVSAADGLGLVRQFVEPGSPAAHVVGVLAVVVVVYLLVRALRRRRREAA